MQVELRVNGFQAALQVADAGFLVRVVLHNVFHHLVGNDNVAFGESDLAANARNQVMLRNERLVLCTVPGGPNLVHAIQQHGIDAALVVVAEDEEALAQVKRHF